MGIRFTCPNGHKLNVKSFLAGKRGICPDCDAKFLVPFESGGQVESIEEAQLADSLSKTSQTTGSRSLNELFTSSGDSSIGLASAVWHARSASGNQRGPATLSLVKSWIADGSVDRDSWVWKTGWLDWQRASDVFPELGAVLEAPPIVRPKPFMEESLVIETEDDLIKGAEAINAHRRIQRQKRERMRNISLILGTMVFVLMLILLAVIF